MWTLVAGLVVLLIAVGSTLEVPVARKCSARISKLAADSSLLQASERFEHLGARGGGHRFLSQIGADTDPLEGIHGSPLNLNCESPCTIDGETHSCRDRVRWLVEEGGSTLADALDTVSNECDGQCTCSPLEFRCESICLLQGEAHSCRDRVQWLVRKAGSTLPDALDTVSNECGGQCMCSGADFIQENSSAPSPPLDGNESHLRGEEDPATLIGQMDTNGDGLLQLEELRSGMERDFQESGETEGFDEHFVPTLEALFPLADDNGDGKLDADELAELMDRFDEFDGDGELGTTPTTSSEPAPPADGDESHLRGREDPATLMEQMDTNGDGLLQLEELRSGMEREFQESGEMEGFDEHFVPTLEALFPLADDNGDGKLDADELADLMDRFDELDSDGEQADADRTMSTSGVQSDVSEP